jgi:4-amino-4-deoxy-L-arabinose transferase-like glycosyltransferase
MGKSKPAKRKTSDVPEMSVVPARFFKKLCSAMDPADRSSSGSISRVFAFVGFGVLLLLLLLVFWKRPFHIDDPLFIWTAKYIQNHPGNPYGFPVNWYGTGTPISDVTKNPPLASYYIVVAAFLLGWSEPALHLAFMAAAVAVGIGTYLIAEKLCKHPLLATLASILTPVFVVSSLTVMSDVLMLAFWVFAVYFWIKGLDTSRHVFLLAAACLIAASAISKYFGIALIPLLFVYSVTRKRAAQAMYLLIPIGVLGWYQWITYHLYGRGLLLDAAAYATTETRPDLTMFPFSKLYVAFVFAGGCIATVLFFARQLWSRSALIGGLVFFGVTTLVFFRVSAIGSFSLPTNETAHLSMAVQLSLWGTVGISLVLLAGLDLHHHRDSESLLLFMWVIGTFLFAGFINWTTNGRSILPMTIPAGIVITRRLERQTRTYKTNKRSALPRTIIPLAATLALSFALAWADTGFAETGKAAAATIHEAYNNRQVWFQGHWGFQYYMEQIGAKPVDFKQFRPIVGDVMVMPKTNTNVVRLPTNWPLTRTFEIVSNPWMSTMNYDAGAGFYSNVFGPLPFVIGRIMPERFDIFEVTR